MDKKQNIDRRDFLKTAVSAGMGSILVTTSGFAGDKGASKKTELPQVPRRRLGKTGVKVPMLALGGIFDILNNQIVLEKAVEWGVKYWDTAPTYGENSELGIGKFFDKHPNIRKEIFLVTKTHDRNPKEMQKHLELSMERMKTDYIDMYCIHGVQDPAEFTDEAKKWAEKAKKSKKINFFGFSTHMNMAKCLAKVSTLGWIDGLMAMYNFRLMQDPEMKAAVEACQKADIGIVAMKTQAQGQRFESEEEKKLESHFLKQGYSEHQVKLKAIWQDEGIASICSQMPNVAIIVANAAAALDKAKLGKADMEFLGEFAMATCNGYCTACADICKSTLPEMPYISEVMRYLMYYNNYGEKTKARDLFAKIPLGIRARLTSIDYSATEVRCPHKLPIGELMAEASVLLS